jgi:hypothetical protein
MLQRLKMCKEYILTSANDVKLKVERNLTSEKEKGKHFTYSTLSEN